MSISRKRQFYEKPTEKAHLFVFNNIAVMGLEDSTILFPPPALLLEANQFTLTEDIPYRKMIGLNEKVLRIVHSVIQKLEQYIHYTGQIINVKLNHVKQKTVGKHTAC